MEDIISKENIKKIFGLDGQNIDNDIKICIKSDKKVVKIYPVRKDKCSIDIDINTLGEEKIRLISDDKFKDYTFEFISLIFCNFNLASYIENKIILNCISFEFINCDFEKEVKFANLSISSLIFKKCNFNNIVDFHNFTIKEKVSFIGVRLKREDSYICLCKKYDEKLYILNKDNHKNSDNSLKIFVDNDLKLNFECDFTDKIPKFSFRDADVLKLEFARDFCKDIKLSFKSIVIKGGLVFKDETFNDIEFNTCTFKESVYFTYCNFKEKTTFCACVFEKLTSFYNSTFEKVPNFSASYFKEQKAVNLINVNVDKISFKSIEKYVENNYKKDENYKKELEEIKSNENKNKSKQKLDKKYKLKCIKNIKDSFRNIKDVLISQNNTLDAQEWHKLELYTMEKEYDIKLEFEKIQDNINIFSNILIWFNCVLLNIYRNTSNHHTNFLKIFHFTIGAVSLYATFCYLIYNFFEQSHTFLLYILTKDFFGLKVVYYILFVFIILCTIMMLLYQNKNNIFTSSLSFVVVYICLYFFYDILPYCLISLNFRELFFFVSVYILSMFLYYIIFLYFQRSLLNFIFKLFLYLTFFFVLISTPQLLNPLLGVFSSDKLYESKFEKSLSELNSSSVSKILDIMQENFENKNSDLNMTFTELNSAKDYIRANKNIIIDTNLTKAKNIMPNYENIAKSAMQDELVQGVIKSTSILYTIILLLCIFSLQKTARKNSIVPN